MVVEAEFDAQTWYGVLSPSASASGTRADGDPHDDEVRARGLAGAATCRRCASWPVSASRSTRGAWSGASRPRATFHDNWWQTETGGIAIANYAAMDIKPGSMGKTAAGHHGGDRPGGLEAAASS